jgi:hypothetical protein
MGRRLSFGTMVGMLCRTCAQPFTTTWGMPNAAECSSCRLMTDWHRLPVDVRAHVDALLRRRSVLAAIIALRELDPGRSLRDAQVIAETRFGELGAAGEVEPAPQATVDGLLATARAIQQRVVAVEGYWDGDNLGWHARLVAVIERPSRAHDRYDEVFLGNLGSADLEDLAKARAVADVLGVPFHFTQPEHADLDLPRWWDHR